jgi:hypothetical protein
VTPVASATATRPHRWPGDIFYAAGLDIAWGYVAIALPVAVVLDLFARFLLRKRLHRLRKAGVYTHRVVAVVLLNVLVGDMSLVGPRPALPAEYRVHMRRQLAVKPGITGLWQVSGRSDLPWDEAERLDLRYVENWSLALDLQILWKTLSAVTTGSGAY